MNNCEMNNCKTNNCKTNNCKFFNMYYASDNLPETGWIQSCVYCDIYTANLSLFKIVKNKAGDIVNVNSYLCRCCLRKINNSRDIKKKYIKKCRKMFNEYKTLIYELHEI